MHKHTWYLTGKRLDGTVKHRCKCGATEEVPAPTKPDSTIGVRPNRTGGVP